MINRRSLRIKAFKNLYAYETCKGANYLLGLDLIDENFSIDLNSMDLVDEEELNRKKALAIECFDLHFSEEDDSKEVDAEVEKDVNEALKHVEKLNNIDRVRFSKDLMEESGKVTKNHLLIISLLEEVAFINQKFSDENISRADMLGEKAYPKTNLADNKVLVKIKNDEPYNKLKSSFSINWTNNEELLGDWYKKVLNKDKAYRDYLKKESINYEEDWIILDYICREIFFKNDAITSLFEEIDLDWSENKPIVRSLVLKTLKSVKDESDDLSIADNSYNWEEDAEFVKELFKLSTQKGDYLESLLKGKLKNWDITRIAMTDRVLLKIALAELVYFPSIPTKVTINEFIEISKTFSTPKSKKFVNGILDALTVELVDSGVIRKSGRGLLDNK